MKVKDLKKQLSKLDNGDELEVVVVTRRGSFAADPEFHRTEHTRVYVGAVHVAQRCAIIDTFAPI